MLRSAFIYVRYGWTRPKVESSFNEFMKTMIGMGDYEHMPRDFDNSLVCRSFLKSLARLYPDLTVRYMGRVVAAMPDATVPEAWDCLTTMLDWSTQGSRLDPRGVHSALVAAMPFTAHWPRVERAFAYRLAELAKADPNYRPPAASGMPALDRMN